MKHFLISCCLLLSSCATLVPNPGEDPKRVTLSAWKPTQPLKTVNKQIMIDMPTISPPLDNQRLALRPQAQLIDYYADVEWSERLALLIQDSLVVSLQDSKLFTGVTRSMDGIIPDYTLKIDVRQFNIHKASIDNATGEYFIQLINTSARQVVAQQTFAISKKLNDESLNMIIETLNEIHVQLSEQILIWLQTKI